MDRKLHKEVALTKQSVCGKIKAAENLLENVFNVESVLEREYDGVIAEVDMRADILRRLIDESVQETKESVKQLYERNNRVLQRHKSMLEDLLQAYREGVDKIERLLQEPDKPSEKPLFNASKVVQMVLESIDDSACPSFDVNIIRIALAKVTDDSYRAAVSVVIELTQMQQVLIDIMFPLTLVKEFKTPSAEVTAMSVVQDKVHPSSWLCPEAKQEMVNYDLNGKHLRKLACDFKVNDILEVSGKILATSSDGKCIYCLTPVKTSNICSIKVQVEDSLYLHGLTRCQQPDKMAACATDTPNYSQSPPNETVIVEFKVSGKELNRFMISNFTGKVYRIAQNVNSEYVMTFPKEGAVLSVDRAGNIRSAFKKRTFKACLRHRSSGTFWPSGLTCDGARNVLVSEYTNKLVLMLDQYLHMLRFVGSAHAQPNALGCDLANKTVILADKGRIQVWKTCNETSREN